MNIDSRRDGMRTGVGLMKLVMAEGKLSHEVITMGVKGLDPEALMALISWSIQTLAMTLVSDHGKDGAAQMAEEMLETIDHYYAKAVERDSDS